MKSVILSLFSSVLRSQPSDIYEFREGGLPEAATEVVVKIVVQIMGILGETGPKHSITTIAIRTRHLRVSEEGGPGGMKLLGRTTIRHFCNKTNSEYKI